MKKLRGKFLNGDSVNMKKDKPARGRRRRKGRRREGRDKIAQGMLL